MVRSETPTAPTPGNVALFSAAIRRGPETTINARWVLRSISGVNLSQSAGLNGNSCAKSWLASASCSGSTTWKSSAADRYNLTVRGGLVTSADVIESVARRTCATLRRTPVAAAVQPVSQADAAGAVVWTSPRGTTADRCLQRTARARVADTDRCQTDAVRYTRSARVFSTVSPHSPHRHVSRCASNC